MEIIILSESIALQSPEQTLTNILYSIQRTIILTVKAMIPTNAKPCMRFSIDYTISRDS